MGIHEMGPLERAGYAQGHADATEASQARIAELEAALLSVVHQCDNVIFNADQKASTNDAHLRSWRSVRDFASNALANWK